MLLLAATLSALVCVLAARESSAQCPPVAPALIAPGGTSWSVDEGTHTLIGATGGGPLFEWDADCDGVSATAGDELGGPVHAYTAQERDGSASYRICVRSFNPLCGAGAQFSSSAMGTVNVRNVAPIVTTATLPAGVEGTLYRATLAASDPANPPNATATRDPITWSATGLPPGLSIDPMTGTISGTPALGAAGVHSVTVTVRDGDMGMGTRTLRLGISNASALTACPTPALPLGADGALSVNEGSTRAITATADENTCLCAIVWDFGCDGSLDASGPTFTLLGERRDGPTDSARLCAVNVPQVSSPPGSVCRASATAMAAVRVANVAPAITTMSLPTALVATPYITQLIANDPANPPVARGFLDPITWTATGLPPGLALDPSTGVIAGALDPTVAARCYPIAITARDGDGGADSTTLDLCVIASAPMQCPNAMIAAARYAVDEGSAVSLSASFAAGGSCGCTIDWDFGCDRSVDARGNSVTFDARGRDGATSTRACWVAVPSALGLCNREGETQEVPVTIANVAPSLSSVALMDATESISYTHRFDSSDPANPPIAPRVFDPPQFSLLGAPAWISVDAMTGVLSAIPPIGTAGTTFSFTVVVEDGDGGRTSAATSLRVLPSSRIDAGADASLDASADSATPDVIATADASADSAMSDGRSDTAPAVDSGVADATPGMDSAADAATIDASASPRVLSGDGACACRAGVARSRRGGASWPGSIVLVLAMLARRNRHFFASGSPSSSAGRSKFMGRLR